MTPMLHPVMYVVRRLEIYLHTVYIQLNNLLQWLSIVIHSVNIIVDNKSHKNHIAIVQYKFFAVYYV